MGLIYVILICSAVPVFYSGNKFIMLILLVVFIIPLIYLYIVFNSKKYIERKTKLNKNVQSKNTKSDDDECIESFKDYKKEINDLKVLFEVKDGVVRDLIEKRFEPPQITYDKFISIVDKSQKLFNTQHETALSIINLTIEDTPRIREEIDNRIYAMKTIIDHIDKLTNELVININEDDNTEEEVKNLLSDMKSLIDSVKEY